MLNILTTIRRGCRRVARLLGKKADDGPPADPNLPLSDNLDEWEMQLERHFQRCSPESFDNAVAEGKLQEKLNILIGRALRELPSGGDQCAHRLQRMKERLLVEVTKPLAVDRDNFPLGNDPDIWEWELEAFFRQSSPEGYKHDFEDGSLVPRLRKLVASARRDLDFINDSPSLIRGIKEKLLVQVTKPYFPPSPLGDDIELWKEELAAYLKGGAPEIYKQAMSEGNLDNRLRRLTGKARRRLIEAGGSYVQQMAPIKEYLLKAVAQDAQRVLDSTKFKTVTIDIAATCNAKCPFCPREQMPKGRMRGFMEKELFLRTLHKAKDSGISTLCLYSTGEPTLHPQFDEFVAAAKELGFFVICSSNGYMMTQRANGLRLVDSLQISVEGWDRTSYERYRHPLKFDRVYEGIKDYAAARPEHQQFTLNFMITRKTDIEQFAGLWANFFDEVHFHFMLPAGEFKNNQYHAAYANSLKDEYFDFVENPDKVCGDPFDVMYVSYDGKQVLCCNDFGAAMDLGTIDESVDDLYAKPIQETARQQFREGKIGMCNGCGQTLDASPQVKAAVSAEVERVWRDLNIQAKYVLESDTA